MNQIQIEVEARRLDGILDSFSVSRVDLLKMNIEGAELDALVSLGDSINLVKNFCISCHDFLGLEETRTHESVVAFLLDQGFKVITHPKSHSQPWKSWYVYASR
jgi:hypothetical protein